MVRGKNARASVTMKKQELEIGSNLKSSKDVEDNDGPVANIKKAPGDYERPWRQKRTPKSPGKDRRKQKRSSTRRKSTIGMAAHIDGGSLDRL